MWRGGSATLMAADAAGMAAVAEVAQTGGRARPRALWAEAATSFPRWRWRVAQGGWAAGSSRPMGSKQYEAIGEEKAH
ncbi:hypothetical protein NL676_016108 [Syzygium grande]|nr:hypothetical protein NL676_016108 [Syzygium grande]